MKRIFFAVMIVCFTVFFVGNVDAGLIGGEFSVGINYNSFDPMTGISHYEGIGQAGSAKISFKKWPLGGIYLNASYIGDSEGKDKEENRHSKIFSFGIGWELIVEIDDLQLHRFNFGVSKEDLRDFCDHEAESDVVVVTAEMENLLWYDEGNVHFISLLTRLEGGIPIRSEAENLGGFRAKMGLIHEINTAPSFSFFHQLSVGYDDGSDGYSGAGLLTYELFPQFTFDENWVLRLPHLTGAYIDSDADSSSDYERDDTALSVAGNLIFQF